MVAATTQILVDADKLRVHFRSFGREDYRLFLKAKALPESDTVFHPADETYTILAPARFASFMGLVAPLRDKADLPLSSFLLDDQLAIVQMALLAKRFAVYSDCGLGKTLIQLEYSRHVLYRTGGRVLLVTLKDIVPQTMDECRRFYGDSLPICRLTSREQMRAWCKGELATLPALGNTNYEKWNPQSRADQVVQEARELSGIILDEASRLNTPGGTQKWALIKTCENIEYKMIATATPAPNDLFEFCSQAGFLNKFRSEDSINAFFIRDNKSHRWVIKPHAKAAFFRWLASWSIYVRHPKRYGWRLDLPEIPPPEIYLHEIEETLEQAERRAALLARPHGQQQIDDEERDTNTIERNKLSQFAKGFSYRKDEKGEFDSVPSLKPGFVTRLIQNEVGLGGHKVIVWTSFDAESDILAEMLRGEQEVAVLTGKTSDGERRLILDRFRNGNLQVVITRASVLGYGQNLQCCSSMIFSGWSDSYAAYYQAVRRAYRFGQKKSLRVHLPVIPQLEKDQLDNIFRKQRENEEAIAEIENQYIAARTIGGAT